ncbi:MAG: MalY/PatB family protein [Clostridiaceae bacterium]|nr:MalY/PatB family protein [Clostridiaceae bacterium]
MNKINFNEMIIRRGTGCAKWDALENMFGLENADDVIPMWVADTDFLCAPEIGVAVKKAVELELYGYKAPNPEVLKAAAGWLKKRFDFEVDTKYMATMTGVVAVVTNAIQTFTSKGDGIIIQTPVYYPFANTIRANERNIIEAPLVESENHGILHYAIDFDVLEKACARGDAKMLVLCSPHNPIGRVWTKEELAKIGEICRKHDVFVLSDEIHGDIIMKGHEFIPFLKACPESYDTAMSSMSASKTFNVAGLHASYVVIPSEDNLKAFKTNMTRNSSPAIGVVGGEALIAAYTQAEYYVAEFNEYIESNFDYMIDFVKTHLPEVKIVKPEGTYLIWLDISAMISEGTDVKDFMAKEVKVAVDPGYWFSEGYKGYIRMNAATTRERLEICMERLEKALKGLKK